MAARQRMPQKVSAGRGQKQSSCASWETLSERRLGSRPQLRRVLLPERSHPAGTTSRGSTAGQGHRSRCCHLTRCHTWSPAMAREDVLSANIAGGGTMQSSCSPRWDRPPHPQVSVDAAAAQRLKLRKEFECRIYVLTNKSITCHRYTVSLKLLIFIS